MNEQIKKFLDALQSEAAVAFGIDAPSKPDGDWWIDLEIDGMRSNVLWKSTLGFGVYTDETGYGGRPQEIYKNASEASARILQLAARWRKDARLHALGLRELRHLVGETQLDVAEALGTDQARVSRIEKGGDMKLSTLIGYLNAIGGTLDLRVRFRSFEAPIQPIDPTVKTRAKHVA
jgi:hypothetical protein